MQGLTDVTLSAPHKLVLFVSSTYFSGFFAKASVIKSLASEAKQRWPAITTGQC